MSDMDTSLAAAKQIEPHLERLEIVVLRVMIREASGAGGFFGLTDEDIATLTGLSPNTARPRRVALVMKGLVEDSGLRRKTRSGRKAIVWRVK